MAVRMPDGKLFQTCVAAAANVLSPKQLNVRWTVSVLVSAERTCLAPASIEIIGQVARLLGYLYSSMAMVGVRAWIRFIVWFG